MGAVSFKGQVATVTETMSARARLLGAAIALVLALCGVVAVWLGTRWVYWTGAAGLTLSVLMVAIVLLVTDSRVVIDAERKVVTIARRFPWQGAEHLEVLPFSAVYSIGVNRTGDGEGGYDYDAVLRFNGGRNISLWRLYPGRGDSERDIAYFVGNDPNLVILRQVTGFHCEHRLT